MTGTLRIKKLASGKSYYYIKLQYKDPRTNSWKSKTLATYLEVKNNKRKAESMINTLIEQYAYLEDLPGTYNTKLDPNILLCEYLDLWLAEKKHGIRSTTVEAYTYRVNFIKKYFDSRKLKLIDTTPKLLDDFFKYSLKYGKINQKTKEKEPLSVRTVRECRNVLYSTFNQAVIDGLVKINPVVSVSVQGKKNHEYSEELLFLTEDEISNLLHFISKYYPRLTGIAFIGAYYGLRRSEILGLKWSAIDFEKKTLTINHTVVRIKTVTASDTTKTQAGRRTLTLFQTAESCLHQIWKEQQDNKRFYKKDYKNQDGYIFTWEDGLLYSPDYITKLFNKATKAFGCPEITLHKLRHSCASMLINKGWDIKKLQYWLGHTDTQTTLNIYSHFNRQRLNESENDLSEISLASADLFAQG